MQLGHNLAVPTLVIVQHLRVKIVAKQRPAGREHLPGLIGLDGEDVAAAFVAVEGFHGIIHYRYKSLQNLAMFCFHL